MHKEHWVRSKKTIGSYKAIQRPYRQGKGEPPDVVLHGKHGQVYEWGQGLYAAALYATRKQIPVLELLGCLGKYSPGDEAIVKFPQSQIDTVAKLIGVPKSQAVQIRYARQQLYNKPPA